MSYQCFQLTDTLKSISIKGELPENVQSNIYHPKNGLEWAESLRFRTDSLQSGYYYLELFNDSDTTLIPFLISEVESKDIAIIASTSTWQAYNDWGGKSFYLDNRSPWGLKQIYQKWPSLKPLDFLPENRPLSFAKAELEGQMNGVEVLPDFSTYTDFEGVDVGSHLIRGEWNLIHYLHETNRPYSVYSMKEFERKGASISAKVFLFNTHSEYWSKEMIAQLKWLLSHGKSVIFAGGNNVFREISYYEKGIKVERNPEFSREEISQLVGTYYTEMTYLKVAGYKNVNPNHWAMKGVGDTFGAYGASGYETDKIGPGSEEFTLLAVGENQAGPAYMVLKEVNDSTFIFNASSIMFTKGLTRDPDIQKIMNNLLSY